MPTVLISLHFLCKPLIFSTFVLGEGRHAARRMTPFWRGRMNWVGPQSGEMTQWCSHPQLQPSGLPLKPGGFPKHAEAHWHKADFQVRGWAQEINTTTIGFRCWRTGRSRRLRQQSRRGHSVQAGPHAVGSKQVSYIPRLLMSFFQAWTAGISEDCKNLKNKTPDSRC